MQPRDENPEIPHAGMWTRPAGMSSRRSDGGLRPPASSLKNGPFASTAVGSRSTRILSTSLISGIGFGRVAADLPRIGEPVTISLNDFEKYEDRAILT